MTEQIFSSFEIVSISQRALVLPFTLQNRGLARASQACLNLAERERFRTESDVWPHITSPGQGLQGVTAVLALFLMQSYYNCKTRCHLLSFAVIYCHLLSNNSAQCAVDEREIKYFDFRDFGVNSHFFIHAGITVTACKHLQGCVKFFSYICQIIQYDYLLSCTEIG